jgi:hypothetical protein
MSLGITKFNKINVLVKRNIIIKDIDEYKSILREFVISNKYQQTLYFLKIIIFINKIINYVHKRTG